jgi:predicted trehalose synthase
MKMPEAEEVLASAVTLAERYGEALVEIHNVLANDTYSDAGKVMRVRLVLAALDPALAETEPTA